MIFTPNLAWILFVVIARRRFPFDHFRLMNTGSSAFADEDGGAVNQPLPDSRPANSVPGSCVAHPSLVETQVRRRISESRSWISWGDLDDNHRCCDIRNDAFLDAMFLVDAPRRDAERGGKPGSGDVSVGRTKILMRPSLVGAERR
jgi:hypothetical protein